MSSPSQHNEQLAMIEANLAFVHVIYAASTVQIWDVVIHFAEDVELLSLPGRYRAPTVAYFLSRYFFLVSHFLLLTAFNTPECRPSLELAVAIFSFMATVLTLFQFFLRVRVIYCEDSRLKMGLFTILWVLASLGTSFTLVSTTAGPGKTSICIIPPIDFTYVVPVIAILGYDSCVFLAISYQIYKLSWQLVWIKSQASTGVEWGHMDGMLGSTCGYSFRAQASALLGRDLPFLTRAILYDGQIYYLISVASGVATLVLLLNTSISGAYRLLLVPVHLVLVNIMTGYVFRETEDLVVTFTNLDEGRGSRPIAT
ncbi:hypothetical protein BDP27DRAFT_1416652 [Rhodocollybia butyracea]|uniref:Uncharacterized protein n=1 Tax=Rhodocollybia butyracea TaxID=206335 RepID=A0A9P5PWU1_9AGAR|nr:hypothetical protein BDP27DRAFT_1416652 [Rhodocollybia butyracea]